MAAEKPLSPPNPFADVIGLRITEAAEGRCRSELKVGPETFNPHGVVHGGVIFAMADNSMGGALYTLLAEGEFCSTIEIKINFLRPVSEGELICETKVIHKGRSTAVLESRVENGGKLAAVAQGTYAILSRHPGS